MQRFLLFLSLISCFNCAIASPTDVIVRDKNNNDHNQSFYPPPDVTFDDETNTLSIYFNFGGTVTLTCDDGTGYVYDVVYHVFYGTGNTMTLPNLSAGYYTLEVDCGFAELYTGNFIVYYPPSADNRMY